MLDLQGVRKSFGDRDLLHEVSFHVAERQRVALVGRNGAGKSTLLKVILGEVQPDGGQCRLAPWATVAYLPQDARCTGCQTLYEELHSVFDDVLGIEERQRQLEAEMHRLASPDPRLMALVAQHGHLQDEFDRLGGYTIEAEIGKVLAGLGFRAVDRDKRAEEFSGGWQMRIALAKLLLARPSLLLLDEPTNHLDLAAVTWLEEYLREYRGAVIVVSHDRYFLDRVSQRTIELADSTIREWSGNYSFYIAEKAKQSSAQQAAYDRQQRFLDEQRAFVERFRASARRSAQAKSRERALDKIERVEGPREAKRSRFRFADHRPSGREVFVLKGVAKGYDGETVFAEADLLVERGDKIALVGENGTGKTTLLRLLAGIEQPDRGTVRVGINVQRSYYAQHQADTLDEANTVLAEVYGAAPATWLVGEVRSLLGRFGITEDEVFKPVAVLSGGERSRVALAKMLLRPANVLLLDEPTNHLDIPAREMLEEALRAYDGSIVVVSHDRFFIERVANRVVEMGAVGLRSYPGSYSHYRAVKDREAEAANACPASVAPPPAATAAKPRAQAPRPQATAKDLAAVERAIGDLEARLRDLTDALASPEAHNDASRSAELLAEYEALNERLCELNGRWEDLARLVEESAAR